jgi:serine protease Do
VTRKLLALFLVLFFFLTSCVRTNTVLDEGGYYHLVNSVVLIKLRQGLCSGFFISSQRILTAAHCVNSDQNVYDVVTYQDYLDDNDLDISTPFYVVEADMSRDLAVLEAAYEDAVISPIEIVQFRTGRFPRVGERTISIGHPTAQLFNMTEGRISRIARRDRVRGVFFLFSSSNVYFGSSGGPLFDSRGRVIGLTSAIRLNQSYLGQYVSFRDIQQFLVEVQEIEDRADENRL